MSARHRTHALIHQHQAVFSVQRMCKMLKLHPSGYYAWRVNPESLRAKEDRRLLGHIKQSWLESGAVYGYRKIFDDLQELGERCGINRVYRLMRSEGIRSQTATPSASTKTVERRLSWRPTICSANSM